MLSLIIGNTSAKPGAAAHKAAQNKSGKCAKLINNTHLTIETYVAPHGHRIDPRDWQVHLVTEDNKETTFLLRAYTWRRRCSGLCIDIQTVINRCSLSTTIMRDLNYQLGAVSLATGLV